MLNAVADFGSITRHLYFKSRLWKTISETNWFVQYHAKAGEEDGVILRWEKVGLGEVEPMEVGLGCECGGGERI